MRLFIILLCAGTALAGAKPVLAAPPDGLQLAQLRMYNREQGTNVSAPAEAGLGGGRVSATTSPVATPVTAPGTAPMTTRGGLRMAPTVSTTVPAPGSLRSPASALGARPAAPSAAPRGAVTGVRPRESGLGTALVFIKGVDFSGGIAANVRKIARTPGLASQFYLQDETPRNLVGMAAGPLQNLPAGVSFSVDLDSRMARANDAAGKNVIVYRDPSGAVRHYNLVSEFAAFLNQLERLRAQ